MVGSDLGAQTLGLLSPMTMEERMLDNYTKFILTLIAGCLLVLTFRIGVIPEARADAASDCKFEGPLEVRITRMPSNLGTESYRPLYVKEAK